MFNLSNGPADKSSALAARAYLSHFVQCYDFGFTRMHPVTESGM